MSVPAVFALRAAATARHAELGLPRRGDEPWRHTNTDVFAQGVFEPAGPESGNGDLENAQAAAIAGLTADVRLIDGRVTSRGPAGRQTGGVSTNLLSETDAPTFGTLADYTTHGRADGAGLWALNTARLLDGAVVNIPAGTRPEAPVYLHFHTDAAALNVSPRVFVTVGKGASVRVIEHHTGHGASWTNAVTEIVVEAGATLDLIRLAEQGPDALNTASTFIAQAAGSHVTVHEIVLGARVSRSELNVSLNGPEAECALHGLYAVDGKRQSECHTTVRHAASHTRSRELYKGVLRDAGRGAFTGRILVDDGMKGCATEQQNPNLLLSADARVETQPQLEIRNNDVKAKHGATIGRLSAEAVFYLRSRGLSADAARRVLTVAFAAEIVDALPVAAARNHAQAALTRLLEAAAQAPAPARAKPRGFDANALREQFPVLRQTVHGNPLAYLDNGATTQKPQFVLDAINQFYARDNANIHRAVHELGERATAGYEAARQTVARFLNAPSPEQIVFTKGTTEAINLVAYSFLRPRLKAGDEILVTGMEHHANLVPWHLACAATGAVMRHVPLLDDGRLDLDALPELLTPRTRLFAFAHVSNALGTVNPVKALIAQAHAAGVPVLIDGAQAVAHLPADELDVTALGADFYVFSGHKIYGPTGIGVLYGKAEHLEAMPPWQGGGDMIREVFLESSTYAPPPSRFEAGTPPIAEAIGLGAALTWYMALDRDAALAHEHTLLDVATEMVRKLPGARIIGTAPRKVAVLSFVLDGVHPHDAGTIVNIEGVAVRAGHHCAQPVMARYGVPATIRATFAPYNTLADVEALERGLRRALTQKTGATASQPDALTLAQSAESARAVAELSQLYHELVIDHGHHPRNTGALPLANHHARGHNPLCGDRLTLALEVKDGVVSDVRFIGDGCAISMASASLMTQAVKGLPIERVEHLYERFHALVTDGADRPTDADELGKLAAFSGVRRFPTRVKCASLAWHTLHAALNTPQHAETDAVTTELGDVR